MMRRLVYLVFRECLLPFFGKIYDYIKQNIFDNEDLANDIINIGFWPG